MRRVGMLALALVLIGGGAIQLVPYGQDHTNPPITGEPAWPSQEARQLAVQACFGCHSNETQWPWYSNLAPISWAVQRDVDIGRRVLNFSEWNVEQEAADDAADALTDGEMPPLRYLLGHPEARLSAAEERLLAQALEAIADRRDRRDNRGPGGPGDPRQAP